MNKDKAIQVRVEADFKEEVEAILSNLGLSTSQAVAIFLKQVKMHKGLPFEVRLPHEPNEATKEVLKKSRKGKDLTEYASFQKWKQSLDRAINED
jgi:DNA-damage-inducible protein J